ncbi:MAG: hypothetical protein ACYC6A_21600 [Armatimonadota bacterium]
MASKKATAINYEIEQHYDPTVGRLRWYLTREGEMDPIAFSTSKQTVIDAAVELSKGRGQIRVRDPKTGQWTEESR